MKKVKFDIPQYEKKYDKEIKVGDVKVAVCQRLSEREKEVTAQRIAYAHLITDKEDNVAFEPYNSQQTEDIIILDTYTNIDIDWIETDNDRDEFLSFIYENEVMDKVKPLCKDLDAVVKMSQLIVDASMSKFKEETSLVNKFLHVLLGDPSGQSSFGDIIDSPEVLGFMNRMSKEKNAGKAGTIDTGMFNLSKKNID